MDVIIVAVLIVLIVFGFIGRYIAEQKGRSPIEGFAFGFLLGPLGWLIEALLPNQR